MGRTLAFGLQHVLTMYGGIIAPPLIIGQAAGLSTDEIGLLVACCLFIGGLATILQSWGIPFFGSKLPLVQGTSFASVSTMGAIVSGAPDHVHGLQSVFGSVIVAALIGLLIAPFFAKVIRFFPPVVTGVVITMIGVSLTPVAANWAMGGNAKAENYGSLQNIGLAALVFALTIVFSKLGNAAISRLSILLAMVVGTLIAIPLGMADFSKVGVGHIFAFPQPLAFGMPIFEFGAILSMTIVVIVILTETTADILAVGEITGAKVDSKRIANGLRADMVSTLVAPFFNTFTQSAFAQNVGLVAITGVKSRFVVTAGGFILVVLGLLPVLGRVIAAVPTPVLGGAGIVLFGTVAASGIRTLSKVNYDGGYNLIIVGASVAFGGIPIVAPTFYDHFPTWVSTILHSGISSAAIMAVLLNIVFNEIKGGNSTKGSVFVAAPPRMVREDELDNLEDGDSYVGGKLIDAEGNEVPVVTATQQKVALTAVVKEHEKQNAPVPESVTPALRRIEAHERTNPPGGH
ncbi:purine permease [Galactobacter caseinivorans]|uniref:Purine permease n=1 Tax=Galactobacter caseinivorans TaxID=2676123 RepID=A0A496PJ86_9MICC|nr:purine permease [Galactobacter caseinivorans]